MKMVRKWIFPLVMIGCAQFALFTVTAMIFYPGGTYTNHSTRGYSFFQNFFSDLGLTQSYLGGPKTVSFILFSLALILAGLSLAAFFIFTPGLFRDSSVSRILSLVGAIFGTVSGLSFIGVAFTPANLYGSLHGTFVQTAFVSFFLAVILNMVAIFITHGYPHIYAWIYVAFAFLLLIYIYLLFFGPSADNQNGLIIQVTGQKTIVYAAIICIFFQAYGAWKLEKQEYQNQT